MRAARTKNCHLMTTKSNQTVLSAEDTENINNLLTRHPLVLVEGQSLMTQQSSVALINFFKVSWRCQQHLQHKYCCSLRVFINAIKLSTLKFIRITQRSSRCFHCSVLTQFPSLQVILPNYNKSDVLFLLFWLFMCTWR